MPIHRPELMHKAKRLAMRAAVYSRRLKRGGMRPLETACAELCVGLICDKVHEMMRLAHVPRPVQSYETPSAWLTRMLEHGHMVLAAPKQGGWV